MLEIKAGDHYRVAVNTTPPSEYNPVFHGSQWAIFSFDNDGPPRLSDTIFERWRSVPIEEGCETNRDGCAICGKPILSVHLCRAHWEMWRDDDSYQTWEIARFIAAERAKLQNNVQKMHNVQPRPIQIGDEVECTSEFHDDPAPRIGIVEEIDHGYPNFNGRNHIRCRLLRTAEQIEGERQGEQILLSEQERKRAIENGIAAYPIEAICRAQLRKVVTYFEKDRVGHYKSTMLQQRWEYLRKEAGMSVSEAGRNTAESICSGKPTEGGER